MLSENCLQLYSEINRIKIECDTRNRKELEQSVTWGFQEKKQRRFAQHHAVHVFEFTNFKSDTAIRMRFKGMLLLLHSDAMG